MCSLITLLGLSAPSSEYVRLIVLIQCKAVFILFAFGSREVTRVQTLGARGDAYLRGVCVEPLRGRLVYNFSGM